MRFTEVYNLSALEGNISHQYAQFLHARPTDQCEMIE